MFSVEAVPITFSCVCFLHVVSFLSFTLCLLIFLNFSLSLADLWHGVRSCFFIYPDKVCLFSRVFNPIAFNVLIDTVTLSFAIFYISCIFYSNEVMKSRSANISVSYSNNSHQIKYAQYRKTEERIHISVTQILFNVAVYFPLRSSLVAQW